MPAPAFAGGDERFCVPHVEPGVTDIAVGRVVVGFCVTTGVVELGWVTETIVLCVAEFVVVTATVFVGAKDTGFVDCAKMTLHELLITSHGGVLVPHFLKAQATSLVNAPHAAVAIVAILSGAVITSSAILTAFAPPETVACQSDSTSRGIVLTSETRES